MQRLFHSRSFYIVIAAVLIVSVLYFLFQTVFTNKIPDDIEIQAVTRGSVIETISETGFVQPVRQVDLAFESGGRVASLSVQEGDFVDEGTILATLDASTILTELSAAYARLEAEQIRLNELVLGADSISLGVTESAVQSAEVTLENAKDTLEKTIAQHDLLVQNARKTLMSSGLEAHFAGKERGNSSNSYEPPVITGTYESNEEGTYIIDPYSSSAASGGSFFLSGLETDTEAISTTNPQALGRRGLYIQFPEDFAKNVDVLWEVPVPNTRSDSYLTNLNAYNTAVEARDAAIAGAENAVKSADAALTESNQQLTQVSSSARDERIEAQRALVRQMRAGAEAIEIAIENMALTAPFTGIVTSVAIEVGEIVSPSSPALSFISKDNFELVVNIPESDIQEVDEDDSATVTFDAYDDASFSATVVKIAPNAEIVDGLRVFKVTLQFDEPDERIRSGLSADIDLFAEELTDVLAVPSRAVIEREDGKFVRAFKDGRLEYLPVTTGLRGSNGATEVLSGLREGEEIITFANEDAIKQLESN